jgi:excisionase family DNA binding protein
MKNMVNCPNWKEYQGLNGWVMFCSAGAFAKTFTIELAEEIGCTEEQRAVCMKLMEQNLGYGLVPEIIKVEAKRPVPAKTVTHIREFKVARKNLDDYPEDLTARMVAEYLEISYTKALNMIKSGAIPAVQSGSEYKVSRQKLEDWLKKADLKKAR